MSGPDPFFANHQWKFNFPKSKFLILLMDVSVFPEFSYSCGDECMFNLCHHHDHFCVGPMMRDI